MLQNTKFARLFDGAYRTDLGRYISESFTLVNKSVGMFIVFTILFFVSSTLLEALPAGGDLVFRMVVSPILLGGFYVFCHHVETGKNADFNDFFSQFNQGKDLILAHLALGLIILAVLVPTFFIFGGWQEIISLQDPFAVQGIINNLNGIETLAIFMLLFLALLASTLFTWTIPLIVFEKMDWQEALTTSFKICKPKIFWYIGFAIVAGCISMIGILGLIIAVLYTFHVGTAMTYVAYRHIVGFERAEADEILDHLVD